MNSYADFQQYADTILTQYMLRRIEAPCQFTIDVESSNNCNRYYLTINGEKFGAEYDIVSLINRYAENIVIASKKESHAASPR